MTPGSDFTLHLITGLAAIIIITTVFITLIYSYVKSKNTSTLLFASFFAITDFWALGSTFYPVIVDFIYMFSLAFKTVMI